jgi:hypothetical protein
MDGLSDEEVEDIFERLNKYIDPTTIKSRSEDGVASELDALMRDAPERGANRKGSLQTLLRNGFARRGARNLVNKLAEIDKQKEAVTAQTEKKEMRKQAKEIRAKQKEVKSIQKKLKAILTPQERQDLAVKGKPIKVSILSVFDKVEGIKIIPEKEKVRIQTSKGQRTYAGKNVKASVGFFKTKPTVYLSNTRTGKIITRKYL